MTDLFVALATRVKDVPGASEVICTEVVLSTAVTFPLSHDEFIALVKPAVTFATVPPVAVKSISTPLIVAVKVSPTSTFAGVTVLICAVGETGTTQVTETFVIFPVVPSTKLIFVDELSVPAVVNFVVVAVSALTVKAL